MSRRGQVWQLDMLPKEERQRYEGQKMRAEALKVRDELRKVEARAQDLVNRIVFLETTADELDPPDLGWQCPYCKKHFLKQGAHLNYCEAYDEHLRDTSRSD